MKKILLFASFLLLLSSCSYEIVQKKENFDNIKNDPVLDGLNIDNQKNIRIDIENDSFKSKKIKSKKNENIDDEVSSIIIESINNESIEGCSVLEWFEKNKCESETLINLAISKMDKSQCEKIKIEEDKNTCKIILKSIIWE